MVAFETRIVEVGVGVGKGNPSMQTACNNSIRMLEAEDWECVGAQFIDQYTAFLVFQREVEEGDTN